MSRRYSSRKPPAPNCRKHPNIPAVSGSDLCKNCLHYERQAKEQLKQVKKTA